MFEATTVLCLEFVRRYYKAMSWDMLNVEARRHLWCRAHFHPV